MNPRMMLLVYGATIATTASQPAFAQQAAQSKETAPATAKKLKDVVVTAEKKVATAQRTPIAMSVTTAEQLTENGIHDVNGLANVAPTLNIGQNNNNTMISIRGISSRDYSETGNPAVSVSIDNVYMQSASTLNAALFDIERIEVLRGPQGTLYGRNATGGAINIQTAKPTDQQQGRFSMGYGNYNDLELEGMLNLPINKDWAMRMAFSSNSHDGYRDNGRDSSRKGDDNDSHAARIHLAYDNHEGLSALLTGEYVRERGTGYVLKDILYSAVKEDGSLSLGNSHKWDLNHQGSLDIDNKAIRLNVNYDFSWAKLSYYGGFSHQHLERDNDQDGGADYTYTFPTNGVTKTINNELRLASTGDGRLTWQTGIYQFYEDIDALTYFNYENAGSTVNYYTFDYDTKAKSYAGFGQLYFDLQPNLKLSAGVRYTKDDKTQTGYSDVAGAYTAVDQHYQGSKVTYHAGVDWQYSDNSLLYAKVDTGFKSGGFKNGYSFNPETLTAYEIGSKNRFLDQHLQANLSAFYYDYSDMQVDQLDVNTGIQKTSNAGKSHLYGFEFETKLLASNQDRIDFSAAYLYSKYDDLVVSSSSGTYDYSGNRLVQAPRWSLSGGLEHDFNLPNGTLTARLQSRYQSMSYLTYRNSEAEKQKSYVKSDLMLTYYPSGAMYTISAYVHNIENAKILTAADEASYAGGYLVQFAAPRTYGVRFSYDW